MQAPRQPAALSLATMVKTFINKDAKIQLQRFLVVCEGMLPVCPPTSADRTTDSVDEKPALCTSETYAIIPSVLPFRAADGVRHNVPCHYSAIRANQMCVLRCAGDASKLVPLFELFTDALREECVAAHPDALVGHPLLEAALLAMATTGKATMDDAILDASGKAIQAAIHVSSAAGSPAEGAWGLALHLLTEVCVCFCHHSVLAHPSCVNLACVVLSPRAWRAS